MKATRTLRRLITCAGRVGLVVGVLFCNRIPLSASGEATSSDARLAILESGEDGIVVEMAVDTFEIERIEAEGEIYHRIHIPQMQQSTTPGAPEVPSLGALLGVPSTVGIHLEVLEAEYETLASYRLHPAPRLEVRGGSLASIGDLANLGSEEVVESFALDAALYAQDAFYPGETAQLGKIGYAREQAVVQVQFYPVQYNPVHSELRIYRRIVARIAWDTAAQVSTAGGHVSSPVYEEVLRTVLLNDDSIEQSVSNASESVSTGTQLYLPTLRQQETLISGEGLKIGIAEEGLYKITQENLLEAGLNLDAVDPRTIQMYHQGAEISIYVAGEADGVFDAADFILFYATELDNVYTSKNVYWLSIADRPGLRMAQHDGTPFGTAPGFAHFPVTYHAEEDTAYWQNMPGFGEDRWFWESRLSPNTEGLSTSRDYKISLGQIASGVNTALIRVRLKGYTGLSHRTRLHINGQVVDEWSWQGQIQYDREVSISHSLLRSGENTVRIEALQTSATVDQILVNWIEIAYSNRYVAQADQLQFGTAETGLQQFTVGGFTNDDIMVFAVSNPIHPVHVTNHRVVSDGEGFKFTFEDNAQTASHYLALTPDRYKQPASLVLDSPSHWKSPNNGADYIIITHREFYESAQRLAEHRRTSGLRVAIISVDDIYDEFNDGIFHPQAIRDFLSYAYKYWAAPAPTYVVLLGDANQDYRDNLKTDTPTYVPSYNIESELFGEVSSDNWFAAISGDDPIPDLLIGRLSAQDRPTAEAIVSKIIAYDQQPPEASWNSHVLLVADDDEPAFRTISEQVATRLPHYYAVDKVYAEAYPPGNPHTEILNSIREGTVLVNYTGHGEYFGWGKWNDEAEFLLQQSDVELLQNNGKLPVITVGNCLNGFFAGPKESPALAETLQRQPNAGAVAMWAPTGYGYSAGHQLLLNKFYEAIFVHDHLDLGAATTTAKLGTYTYNSFWGELIQTYILFGDPATYLGIPTNFPYIRQTTPADGASDVALDQTLQVAFSKPMDPATVTLSNGGGALQSTPAWNDDFTIVEYAHAGFEHGMTYEFPIEGQDRNGEHLGPGTAPNPWSVTATTDNAPLTATISISGGDPSSVLTTASIDVVFNKPVRIESVTYSITPFVSGSLQWDGSEQRATFTHDRFQVGQTYTFAIPSAADAAGNPLSTAVELTFTVGSTTYTHLPHIGSAGD